MSWRLKRVDDVNDLLEEMRDTDEREREREALRRCWQDLEMQSGLDRM